MIWITVLVLLTFILIYCGRRPNYYRNQKSSDFVRFIEGLITSGGDGCLLIIRHQKSNCFVQFAKYITDDRSHTIINFGFPDAKWSRDYFKPLCDAFDKLGINYRVQGTGDHSDLVPRFIELDRNVDQARKTSEELARLAEIAFMVMGIDKMQTFRIHYEGDFTIESIRGRGNRRGIHMKNSGSSVDK
jgi:hypothetical protein